MPRRYYKLALLQQPHRPRENETILIFEKCRIEPEGETSSRLDFAIVNATLDADAGLPKECRHGNISEALLIQVYATVFPYAKRPQDKRERAKGRKEEGKGKREKGRKRQRGIREEVVEGVNGVKG